MKKKLIIIVVASLTSMLLVSCGTNKKVKTENKENEVVSYQSDKLVISEEEYRNEVDSYFNKLNKLVMKREEALIQASRDIVASEAYKEWQAQSEKLATVQLADSKSAEKLNKSIEAITGFSQALSEYFIQLSESNVEEFNEKNDELEVNLNIARKELVKSFSGLKKLSME